MNYFAPPKLLVGDQAGIISPSGPVLRFQKELLIARDNLAKELGLTINFSPNAFAEFYYSGGTIQQRLADFHAMILDPKIKIIIFSRGGGTGIDLLPGLDYELIAKNPKIITGISDATIILNAISAKTGLFTFLGPELKAFAEFDMSYEIESMRKTWFTDEVGEIKANPNWTEFEKTFTTYQGWRTIRKGQAVGRLIGGNSNSFNRTLFTPYQMELAGNILVLEFYREQKKGIHQYFQSLKLQGVLDKISGLIIGYCLESDQPDKIGNDRDIADLLLEVTSGYDFPIMQIGEIGHNVANLILPIGALAELDATNAKFIIKEATVI